MSNTLSYRPAVGAGACLPCHGKLHSGGEATVYKTHSCQTMPFDLSRQVRCLPNSQVRKIGRLMDLLTCMHSYVHKMSACVISISVQLQPGSDQKHGRPHTNLLYTNVGIAVSFVFRAKGRVTEQTVAGSSMCPSYNCSNCLIP